MTDIDLAKLRGLAEKATPGPFDVERRDQGDGDIHYIVHGGPNGDDFAWCLDSLDRRAKSNAAFIAAANPQTVLALVAVVEAAQRVEYLAPWMATLAIDGGAGSKRAPEIRDALAALREALKRVGVSCG